MLYNLKNANKKRALFFNMQCFVKYDIGNRERNDNNIGIKVGSAFITLAYIRDPHRC